MYASQPFILPYLSTVICCNLCADPLENLWRKLIDIQSDAFGIVNCIDKGWFIIVTSTIRSSSTEQVIIIDSTVLNKYDYHLSLGKLSLGWGSTYSSVVNRKKYLWRKSIKNLFWTRCNKARSLMLKLQYNKAMKNRLC